MAKQWLDLKEWDENEPTDNQTQQAEAEQQHKFIEITIDEWYLLMLSILMLIYNTTEFSLKQHSALLKNIQYLLWQNR